MSSPRRFPEATILAPVLDFAGGYDAAPGLVEMAEVQLGVTQEAAQEAYRAAVDAQLQAEAAMQELGAMALREALADGKPALLLVGRSYNAFPPEASQSIARKLASMGVRVIPGDCLPQERVGPTAWHYPNLIMNAVALAKRHPNLFLLYVSNFSCTIDAFTHSFFASEMGAKPYLMLEIDAHTADAGIQTRLEAFWDILRNYHSPAAAKNGFQAAAVDGDGTVVTSAGQRIPFRDPRVKIYFPTFSHYHAQAVNLARTMAGAERRRAAELSRRQLERGLQYSSGRECLPLPVCVGQMLEIHEQRQPGEVVGFYMVRGRRAVRRGLLPRLLPPVHPQQRAARPVHFRSPDRRRSFWPERAQDHAARLAGDDAGGPVCRDGAGPERGRRRRRGGLAQGNLETPDWRPGQPQDAYRATWRS